MKLIDRWTAIEWIDGIAFEPMAQLLLRLTQGRTDAGLPRTWIAPAKMIAIILRRRMRRATCGAFVPDTD